MPTKDWPRSVKRIVATHAEYDTDGTAVEQHTATVPLKPILDDQAAVAHLFAHPLPTPLPVAQPPTDGSSSHGSPRPEDSTLSNTALTPTPHSISPSAIAQAITGIPGVVLPFGINAQITELRPHFRVGMHRTSSIDYNIFVSGSAWHLTPSPTAQDPARIQRELIKAGDIVVQNGTMHAWEATEEGARWFCVVVASGAVEVDGKRLEDVDF